MTNVKKRYFHIDENASSEQIYALLDDVGCTDEDNISNLMNHSNNKVIADEEIMRISFMRISFIRPHEEKSVTDFQVKSEIFNSHFDKQCFLLKNGSRIPTQLLPHINTGFSTVRFSDNDILKVIRKLDPSKVHGLIK